jgi:DNA-binding MarR family transcriptional regulator
VTLQDLGESTPSFLAERLGVSRAAVSQRLAWFEERKLVDISSAKDSQKNLSLRLTKRGVALASESADFLEVEFRKLFYGLPDVDLDGLDKTLKQLTNQLIERQEAKDAA